MGFFSDDPLHEMVASGFAIVVGLPFGLVREVCGRVPPGDDDGWYEQWRDAGTRLEAAASEVAERSPVDARELFLDAAMCHFVSAHPLFGAPVDPRLLVAYRAEKAAFALAAELMEPRPESGYVAFDGARMPFWFFPAATGKGPRPTIVAVDGYDATLHTMFRPIARPAVERGYNCLVFDGPGQGEVLCEQGVVLRADWDRVVRPVLDHVLDRPDVDAARVALVGWSLGGLLAIRAAAVEHRLAACIADPALYGIPDAMRARLAAAGMPQEVIERYPDLGDDVLGGLQAVAQSDRVQRWILVQRGFWVSGAEDMHGYLRATLDLTVAGHVDKVECPTLVCRAEADPLSATAQQVYDELTCPREFVTLPAGLGAGDHCEVGNRRLFDSHAFDWLARTMD